VKRLFSNVFANFPDLLPPCAVGG